MWLRRQYERISNRNDNETEIAIASPNKSLWTSKACVLVLGILIGYMVYGFGSQLFELLTHELQTKNVATALNCGNTTAEARARGCEFDVLSYSWIPRECRDRQTDDEFIQWLYNDDRQLGPWPFFTDREMKNRIPDANALSERVNILSYTPQEEHIGHCIFWYRRLHRALSNNFKVDIRGRNLNHTMHCTTMVLKSTTGISEEYATLRTHFGVTFGHC
ncbi:hypothetical protein F5884DRAFT_865505 [Xylogone sp. PMI_703]|nr:hypothetical protein F5884DRAFT_865505 [Xylogone sp. PMI_703]